MWASPHKGRRVSLLFFPFGAHCAPNLCHLPLLGKAQGLGFLPSDDQRLQGVGFQAPCERPVLEGPWVPGPTLLVFPDRGVLGSVSFQTLGDHTALFKVPRAGRRVARLSSRTRPRGCRAGLQTLASCRKAGTCGGRMLLGTSSLADAEGVTGTFPSLTPRGFCLMHRAGFGRRSVSKIYEYTHQGLRYWMILYKLLKCFSAQSVA